VLFINIKYNEVILIIKNIYMAKRATSLHPHKKSKHSKKTAKRLAVKKVMLGNKRNKKSAIGKKKTK